MCYVNSSLFVCEQKTHLNNKTGELYIILHITLHFLRGAFLI